MIILAWLGLLFLVLLFIYAIGDEYITGNDGWPRRTTVMESLKTGIHSLYDGIKKVLPFILWFVIVVGTGMFSVITLVKYYTA